MASLWNTSGAQLARPFSKILGTTGADVVNPMIKFQSLAQWGVVYGLGFATWSFMKFAPNINDISMQSWALKLCWQQQLHLRRRLCLPAVVWPSITTLILTMGTWVAANGLMTMPCPQSGAWRSRPHSLAASGGGYPTFDHGTHPFPTCQASEFDRRSPPTSGKVMILYAGVASSKHSAPTGRDAYLAKNAPCWNHQTGQTVHVAALSMNKAARFASQPRYIIVSVFSLKWTLAVPASWQEKIRAADWQLHDWYSSALYI